MYKHQITLGHGYPNYEVFILSALDELYESDGNQEDRAFNSKIKFI